MRTEYEITKVAYDPSPELTSETSKSPATFIDELYYLLFRNQKAEVTIYSISLAIAMAYAIVRHFTFEASQRTVLIEGSIVALATFITLILMYIISARKRGVFHHFLTFD